MTFVSSCKLNPITRTNIPLLLILDAVKAVKLIPDTTVNDAVRRFIVTIGQLPPKDTSMLVALVEKYTPQTRALNGAILELGGYIELAAKIRMTLHPSTSYKIGVSEGVLPNHKNWSIA